MKAIVITALTTSYTPSGGSTTTTSSSGYTDGSIMEIVRLSSKEIIFNSSITTSDGTAYTSSWTYTAQ